jgi:hypothetical protein
MRRLSDKIAAVRRDRSDARVAGVLAVRATRRNRARIAELAPVIEARFPASSITCFGLSMPGRADARVGRPGLGGP